MDDCKEYIEKLEELNKLMVNTQAQQQRTNKALLNSLYIVFLGFLVSMTVIVCVFMKELAGIEYFTETYDILQETDGNISNKIGG